MNDICRWGNFNNIRILQSFPIPTDTKNIWNNFNLTELKTMKFCRRADVFIGRNDNI